MYGTLLLTLAAAIPCVSVPVLVAVEQFNAVMVPAGGFTVLVKVQVCPPMFRAKLAVPFDAGETHGIVVAPTDQGGAQWGYGCLPGTSQAFGSGRVSVYLTPSPSPPYSGPFVREGSYIHL